MNRRSYLVLAAFLSIFAAPALAEPSDPQFRLLLHKQHVAAGRSVGFAGWAAAPNILADGPQKGFFVGGILFKGKDRWTEVMVGGIATTAGSREEVVDLRTYAKTASGKLDGFAEVWYNFDASKWTLASNSTAATRLPWLRIGVELDTVLVEGKPTVADGGPRLVLPFEFANGKKSNFAVSYHREIVGKSPSFMRAYLLLNF